MYLATESGTKRASCSAASVRAARRISVAEISIITASVRKIFSPSAVLTISETLAAEAPRRSTIRPTSAGYHAQLHEWVMPYESVRAADDPDEHVRGFLESTYAVAANLARWDRIALEH